MNKEHLHPEGRPYTKEEFVEKIKTDKLFAKRFGDLGKIYGKQWRNWNDEIDQISELIRQLKEEPDSRRMVVNAWAVHDLSNMVLPPCHYGFQVWTRELSAHEREDYYAKVHKYTEEERWEMNPNATDEDVHIIMDEEKIPRRAISLMWNQRSVDVPLGLPFNIASYGLLLEILAKEVNMVPEELIGNLGDCHIYENQIDGIKEQMGRELNVEERVMIFNQKKEAGKIIVPELKSVGELNAWSNKILDELLPTRTRNPFPLPKLIHGKTDAFYKALSESQSLYTHLTPSDFTLENYQCHPKIVIPLSN